MTSLTATPATTSTEPPRFTPFAAVGRLTKGYAASMEAARLLRLSDTQLAAKGLTRQTVVAETFARHGLV
ncbi:MAG: hypothetical protein AAGK98_15530 [Pseudomonadota bacterium]